jgi:allantoinase
MYLGIYSKRCWIENKICEATVYFDNGLISRIEKNKPADFSQILDAADAVVMPGVIDVHVHVNEPGRTSWEGLIQQHEPQQPVVSPPL